MSFRLAWSKACGTATSWHPQEAAPHGPEVGRRQPHRMRQPQSHPRLQAAARSGSGLEVQGRLLSNQAVHPQHQQGRLRSFSSIGPSIALKARLPASRADEPRQGTRAAARDRLPWPRQQAHMRCPPPQQQPGAPCTSQGSPHIRKEGDGFGTVRPPPSSSSSFQSAGKTSRPSTFFALGDAPGTIVGPVQSVLAYSEKGTRL